jgi:hypothetical protein
LEQTARSEIDRSKDVVREGQNDERPFEAQAITTHSFLGSVLLMLACMALFGAARFFVA